MTKAEGSIRRCGVGSDVVRTRPNGNAEATPLPEPNLTAGVAAVVALAEARSDQVQEAQAWLNEGGAVGAPAARSPLRILVVEDDNMLSYLISDTLEAMGHEVCGIAPREEDAVTMAARERPDLILVDAHLDVGSGLGAMRRILLCGPMPHIFMSGDDLSAEPLGPGALALQKPFRDVDLERAIQQALALTPSR